MIALYLTAGILGFLLVLSVVFGEWRFVGALASLAVVCGGWVWVLASVTR